MPAEESALAIISSTSFIPSFILVVQALARWRFCHMHVHGRRDAQVCACTCIHNHTLTIHTQTFITLTFTHTHTNTHTIPVTSLGSDLHSLFVPTRYISSRPQDSSRTSYSSDAVIGHLLSSYLPSSPDRRATTIPVITHGDGRSTL